jgi:hypothetical protein
MEPDAHRRKAGRIEGSLAKLRDQADYEIIIESCYAATIQYLADL